MAITDSVKNYWTGLGNKPANLFIPLLLFVLLSPGLLLKVDKDNYPFGKAKWFNTMTTSYVSIFTHALVFFLLYTLLRHNFAAYY